MEAKYIHPVLQEAFSKVSPAIQIETDLTFDIALRINEILIRKNWTQADLAKATGKTEALVSTWLSGKHNFTIRTLAVIEAALGEGIISVKKCSYSTGSISSSNSASDEMLSELVLLTAFSLKA